MKFKDGYWELKDGVTHLPLAGIVDIAADSTALTVWTCSKKLSARGDRVGVPQLTTVFSSPAPDVIHVRRYHHKGGVRRLPEFALPADAPAHIDGGADGVFKLCAGELAVEVSRPDGTFIFTRNGRELTSIAIKNAGYFNCSGAAFMAEYLNLAVGENVYGLGERWTAFVKNGQSVDIWNEDGGTSSEQAYKNIPFYLSSRGYGVFVADPGRVSFEIASEVVSAAQFSVAGELLDYYIIAGATLKEVLRNYTAMTGRPALPPAWSFGLWLSTSFTTDYDEKTVASFIDGMKERDIPLHVFHFDCFWMKESCWVDFQWDTAQFPDPAAMLARLKERGLKICLWINPYIAQKSPLFDEGAAQGFLVTRTSGDIWQWDRWQPGMAIIDFTNPDAAAWYCAALKKLLDMGVDCFKTDFGERIPALDIAWHNGADNGRMHNFYTYLYNKTVFELLKKERGEGEAVLFARSATAACQCFPVHWGGDCSATYPSMAETLRGGLSLSLAGFGFWSHDISGFEQTAKADLFKRWTAFGLLSTHSRLHGNQSYRVPWHFDDEACDVLRFFVKLKCSLMPYLFAQAVYASTEGIPVMRPMVLEWPDDNAAAALDRQYMLGDSLLAAPVFSEDGVVSYYLPAGRWTNIIDGTVHEGGAWRTERHGYLSLPLLAAPNSIIAFGANKRRPDYDYADGITFQVFELEDGTCAAAKVFGTTGRLEIELAVTRRGAVIHVQKTGGSKPWNLLLRGIQHAKADGVTGQSCLPEGVLFAFAAGINAASIRLNG